MSLVFILNHRNLVSIGTAKIYLSEYSNWSPIGLNLQIRSLSMFKDLLIAMILPVGLHRYLSHSSGICSTCASFLLLSLVFLSLVFLSLSLTSFPHTSNSLLLIFPLPLFKLLPLSFSSPSPSIFSPLPYLSHSTSLISTSVKSPS